MAKEKRHHGTYGLLGKVSQLVASAQLPLSSQAGTTSKQKMEQLAKDVMVPMERMLTLNENETIEGTARCLLLLPSEAYLSDNWGGGDEKVS
jgi:hypothetical protein